MFMLYKIISACVVMSIRYHSIKKTDGYLEMQHKR